MFQIDEDMTIYVTRGDTAFFTVSAENDGEPYKFQMGDVVRMKVFEKKNCENVVFQKDFAVLEECEKVNIILTEEETKIGTVINKHKDYWYEIELNPFSSPQTIVGYDDDGAKIFRLFPEGGDLGSEIKKEDIPVVDSELSLTSTRPVENQAVTRGLLAVSKKQEKTEEALEKAVTDVEKAFGDINTLCTRVNEIIGSNDFNEGVKTYELIHEQDEHTWESRATLVTNGVFAVVHLRNLQSRSSESQSGSVLYALPEELCPLEKTEVYDFETSTAYICAEESKCALTLYGNTGEQSYLNRYFYYPLKSAGLAEVNDARVGVDGTAYNSLGEAIRGQILEASKTGGMTPEEIAQVAVEEVGKYLESYEVPEDKIAQAVERYLAEHDEADVKLGQVTLLASAWKGIGSTYSQIVEIEGVTENSKVDLRPSAEQLAEFYEKNHVFVTENDGGVVTVYVVGDKPQVDYTIQLTITEVDYE